MSNEISADQINSIMTVLSSAGADAVEHYARWYFTNAMVWLLVGLSLIGISVATLIICYKHREKLEGEAGFIVGCCFLVTIIGLLVVGDNITNLFEPTAYGIRHLIEDIRG